MPEFALRFGEPLFGGQVEPAGSFGVVQGYAPAKIVPVREVKLRFGEPLFSSRADPAGSFCAVQGDAHAPRVHDPESKLRFGEPLFSGFAECFSRSLSNCCVERLEGFEKLCAQNGTCGVVLLHFQLPKCGKRLRKQVILTPGGPVQEHFEFFWLFCRFYREHCRERVIVARVGNFKERFEFFEILCIERGRGKREEEQTD